MYGWAILATLMQKYGASENQTMTLAVNVVGDGVVIKNVNREDLRV